MGTGTGLVFKISLSLLVSPEPVRIFSKLSGLTVVQTMAYQDFTQLDQRTAITLAGGGRLDVEQLGRFLIRQLLKVP